MNYLIKPNLEFDYPSWIDIASQIIGEQRRQNKTFYYDKNPSKKRGIHDDDVHPLGVKGELIFANYLREKKIKFKWFNINGERGYDGPDFTFTEIVDFKTATLNVDIKTIRQTGWDLFVPDTKLIKDKDVIDAYIFIDLGINGKAYGWFYLWQKVAHWPKKNTKYNNNHFLRVKPITNV